MEMTRNKISCMVAFFASLIATTFARSSPINANGSLSSLWDSKESCPNVWWYHDNQKLPTEGQATSQSQDVIIPGSNEEGGNFK